MNGFGLINMFRPTREHEQKLRVTFGRVYDPKLGRFLSPDPILQDAGNTQNLNRYSHVLNNPLKYTDPSGYTYRAQAVTFKGRENPDGSYGNFAGFDGGGGSVFQKMGVLNGEAGPTFEDLYILGVTGKWVRKSDLQKDVKARYVSKDAYVSVGSQRYYKGSSLHLSSEPLFEPVVLNYAGSLNGKSEWLSKWWNDESYTNKLSREVFRMDNSLGHATWSMYSSSTIGSPNARINITTTNGRIISTSYNYGNLSLTAENMGMSYKMWGSLLEIGVSLDGFNGKIGTSSFGIESTYKPSRSITMLGVAAAITLSGQFELYPTLIPLISK